jgi:GxxExxY protein
MQINTITGQIIRSSYKIHSLLGPGLLESSYEACLFYELQKSGLRVERQVPLPLYYEEVRLDIGYRIDLLVENEVIVEIKAQESLLPVHHAQILSHLRLSRRQVGLLINFHEVSLKEGIVRKVNNYKEPSASSQSSLAASALKRLEDPLRGIPDARTPT